MITQENKWHIMTTIGMPWSEIDKVSEEDLKFLLKKADEIKQKMEQQRNQQPQLMPPNYS